MVQCRNPRRQLSWVILVQRLLALELVLGHAVCRLKKLLLFPDVIGLETSSNTGTWVTTSVHDVLSVVVLSVIEKRLDSWLGETPCTSVQRLFLSPDNCLGIGVAVKVVTELRPREGIQLLDTCNGHIFDVVIGTVFVEGCVDLACAKDDTLDFVVANNVSRGMCWVRNDPLEV